MLNLPGHEPIKNRHVFIEIMLKIRNIFWLVGLVYGVYRHFQQYFSYIVVVSFIVGGNWSTSLHNAVSSTPRHERVRTHNFSGDRH